MESKNNLLSKVPAIIAVASNKGGVSKSTTAISLAAALARRPGTEVGLLDLDLTGPNVCLALPETASAYMDSENTIYPGHATNVLGDATSLHVVSPGMFYPPGEALAWRGPKLAGATEQLLRDVDWGACTHLVVDMPPGTSDAALSVGGQVSGVLLVSSAEDSALADVERTVDLYNRLHVPILGMVETLSEVSCPHGSTLRIHGSATTLPEACRKLGVDFLGRFPLVSYEERAGGHPAGAVAVKQAADAVADAVESRLDVFRGLKV